MRFWKQKNLKQVCDMKPSYLVEVPHDGHRAKFTYPILWHPFWSRAMCFHKKAAEHARPARAACRGSRAPPACPGSRAPR